MLVKNGANKYVSRRPKKPDATDTLYTLIRRLKPVIEQHSDLKIESDRSKSYRLEIRQICN